MPPPFLIIGQPENRRVTGFVQALTALQQPDPIVISWLEILTDPSWPDRLPSGAAIVRIDSAGEHFETERHLLARGYEAAVEAGARTIPPAAALALTEDRGLIVCPRQAHFGLEAALGDLAEQLRTHPELRCQTPIPEIRAMFDKRITARRYAELGLSVPPRIDAGSTLNSLIEGMRSVGCRSSFVKLSCGSSASCLGIVALRGDTVQFTTTMERAGEGYYNSLRLRRYRDRPTVRELVEFLLREGAHVEARVPKARLDRAFFDLRVLVIDGGVRFFVVRQNEHPITNLHLGGLRGSPATFESVCPPPIREAAFAECVAAAASHRAFCAGVDVMFERDFAGHRILETNAFGDLLPGLERDGLSVYGWQIQRAIKIHAERQ